MEYNTQRERLRIPEYGRNIQKIVDFMLTEEDRSIRTQLAFVTIDVMKQVVPQVESIEDYEHKLWDHLHIIADYKLDVDSPYEMPKRAEDLPPPRKTSYPENKFKFRYYGKHIENVIKKVLELPEGEDRDEYTLIIANQLKRSYLNWNRDSVSDDLILKHLNELSDGQLSLKEGVQLINTYDVVNRAKKTKPTGKNQNSNNSKNNAQKKQNGAKKQWNSKNNKTNQRNNNSKNTKSPR